MKTKTANGINNSHIIRALTKSPWLADKVLDTEQIWYPNWKQFRIIRAGQMYLLFEKRKLVFYNILLDVVKNELMERGLYFRTAIQKQYKRALHLGTCSLHRKGFGSPIKRQCTAQGEVGTTTPTKFTALF